MSAHRNFRQDYFQFKLRDTVKRLVHILINLACCLAYALMDTYCLLLAFPKYLV